MEVSLEHFRRLHQAPDRHLAARRGLAADWPCRVAAAAGGAAAAGRLPDDPGHGPIAGRESGNDGRERRAAAGTAVLADPGAVADDVEQLAGPHAGHAAVRSRPQYR